MRLREVSERVREVMERDPEGLLGDGTSHALVQDIQEVQTVYRPVKTGRKNPELVPWLAMNFEPFSGLIEPFNVYPGRFWSLQRVHRQPSGLPELVTHVERELPGAGHEIAPDLYCSFSLSPKIETIVKQTGKDPAHFRFYHRGNLIQADRSTLGAEFCLPGISEALPEGYPDDGIPGIVDHEGEPVIYLGDLTFYNQGRTANRAQLCNLLLNCVAVSVVARYVRDIVRKSLQ